ncbi:protein transport protein Sec24C isoform X1 [Phycodurus eques]|uniref:protein transport protein Sec24C isoform X1 n=1 Tax=Phycodurus eques TaxID=693459 RepID=UPI002ACE0B44|nr:protein transport protein Sec24C isoform X1 [Phycodurus eques]XP_061528441.1 protein transport protein Sec24C isoform X1 [Phycodurus eques]
MMDGPPANQSPLWAGQCSSVTASEQGLLYGPRTDLQHLTLGAPSEQTRSCSPPGPTSLWTPHGDHPAGSGPAITPTYADGTQQISPSSESRYGLDPALLPSAVQVMADDRAEWEGKVFVSEPFGSPPPLATTSCIMEDRGSASPRAIRCTTYCFPQDGPTALLVRLPLAALVTPLARPDPLEKRLPVVMEDTCVSGCRWCRASMCPAMSWQDCGERFRCPFCDKLTEVPWQPYQPTNGVDGSRLDWEQRPELNMGSYEILHALKGEAAVLLLAIDVSTAALRSGYLQFVMQQIHTLLASLHRDVHVGLLTYDSRIQLYDLSPALSRPHMLVMAERSEELQLPVREGLVLPLRDCMDSVASCLVLCSVLQHIPQLSPECDDSAVIPVELPVKAGLTILQTLGCPGKLLVFHASPLVETDQPSAGIFGASKPKSIFQPPEGAVSLAEACVRQGCGIHLFVLSPQNVGGAWPGHVPYLTGGALYAYDHLQGDWDRERFCRNLRRIVEADVGYKAELSLFVSKGMRVSGCYGLFVPKPSPSQVTMAMLDWQTTLAIEVVHDAGVLDEMRGVAIQAVLAYTTETGERRSRVHTVMMRCSRHLQDTFRQYQAQTLLAFYCKKMYCVVLERPLQDLREELQRDLTEALASYRRHGCSASAWVSSGQLVLPRGLRALPVYVNSLRKSDVLLPCLRTSVHRRLRLRCRVLGLDAAACAMHFYPMLMPLPLSRAGNVKEEEEGALRCSAASLRPGRMYLLHAPNTLLLWVGACVPACTLVELFNVRCLMSLPSGETKLPVLDTPLSVAVRSLVDALDLKVPCFRQLLLVKQGDAGEELLQRHLVEDKSPNGGASYADFLYHLHVTSVRLLH